jgi:hypothetical protein
VWSYPQVFITEFNHGYAGYNTGWEAGWTTSFVTSFDTVNITRAAAYHWNSSNDGAGTGMDADLLDGQQGTFYTNATNIVTGTLATDHGGTGLTVFAANEYFKATSTSVVDQFTPDEVWISMQLEQLNRRHHPLLR